MPPRKARAELVTPTAAEWSGALKLSQLDARSIEIAHMVLIERKTQSAVAKEFNVTRQWVSHIVARMLNHIHSNRRTPTDWISRTVTLPRGDWSKVRELERAARSRLLVTSSKKRTRR